MAEFQVNNTNKTFTIVVSGFKKDASNFVEELKREVAKINPANYYLILDGEDMSTFRPNVLLVLEQAYALYMSFGFKKIVVLSPKKVTPRLQIKRIAKKCNFTGVFVMGHQEALKLISAK